MENNLSKSIDMIDSLYNNLSYFDIYGGSVLIFITITCVVIIIATYCQLMVNAQAIKDDWVNQRCNPKVMPFAGFINKPDNKSINEFTAENFSYCTQDILTNLTGEVVQPFQFLTNYLLSIFQGFLESINKIREVMAGIRENMREIAENILHRILNVMIPLQRIFSALMDSLNKTQGVLTASLYTSLGSYYTLKSLLGAIVELIVKMLIVLVGIIVGLWVIPVTWPAAATMSAVFLSISIPLAIIVGVMTEVLNIHSSAIPKLKCFDEKTPIIINNSPVNISQVKIGNKINSTNKILGKIKLMRENEDIYLLGETIVSGSHKVFENNQWIKIKNSKESKLLEEYNKKYIHCLITENKTIEIGDKIYLDWDEKTNEHQKFNYGGFSPNCILNLINGETKFISEIDPGDLLANGEIVYGIIEMDAYIIKDIYRNHLGNFQYFYSSSFTNYMFPKKISQFNKEKENTHNFKVYHLLTSTGTFFIENIEFNDYNKMSEYL